MDSYNTEPEGDDPPFNPAEGEDRRLRLCPAGEMAESFLDHSRGRRDRVRRTRRLITWGARRYFGLSQEDLAAAFGVTQPLISRWTKGVGHLLGVEAARLGLTREQCGLPVEQIEEDAAA